MNHQIKLIESKIDNDNILKLTYSFIPVKPLKFIKITFKIEEKIQEGEWFKYEMINK